MPLWSAMVVGLRACSPAATSHLGSVAWLYGHVPHLVFPVLRVFAIRHAALMVLAGGVTLKATPPWARLVELDGIGRGNLMAL